MVRPTLRTGALALVAAVAVACQAVNPAPAASPVLWGDRVPAADPAAVAAQPVVTHGTDTITLLPISPTGAQVGVAYGYDMPHCGINSPIDVDGSFWDAVGVPDTSTQFDGQAGIFRLDTQNQATFIATAGGVLQLVRHSGAKEFRLCS